MRRAVRSRRWAPVLLAIVLGVAGGFARGAHSQAAPSAVAPSAESQLASVAQEIREREAEKARIEAEISGLADARARARGRLKSQTRSLYRVARLGAMSTSTGFDGLLTQIARVHRLAKLVRSSLDRVEELRTRGDVLRDESARVSVALDRAYAMRRELEAAQQRVAQQLQVSALFDAAFASSVGASGGANLAAAPGAGYGMLRVVDEPTQPAGFESLRGSLAMPVDGARELVSVDDPAEGSMLRVRARAGAAVRAGAAGRVAFADRHESLGHLVIVDHGDRYFTVYGGLGTFDVRVGDEVSAGARIGGLASDVLTFQVRRGSRAVDPRPWFGL